MKTTFIEARCKEKFPLPNEVISKLPKHLTLTTTVQYISSLEGIKKQLADTGIKAKLIKGSHSKYDGQMLGCDIDKADDDNYLYIGDGEFHPKALLLKGAKKVFAFNPFTKTMKEMDEKDVDRIKKKVKGALLKFKISKNIGVIMTKKPGQDRLQDALKFKAKWEGNIDSDPDKDKNGIGRKNIFLFLCDTLDFNELENFPFIECWINTMCPRIGYDDSGRINKPIINIDVIEQ